MELSMEKEETLTLFHFQRRSEQTAQGVSPLQASGAPLHLKVALQGDNPVTI